MAFKMVTHDDRFLNLTLPTVHLERLCTGMLWTEGKWQNLLAFRMAQYHMIKSMKRRSSQQIVALLLGVFLALGMGLSAVQANDMAMCSDMDGCNDCGNRSDCDRNGGACLSVCTTPTPAVLNPAVNVPTAEASNFPLPDSQSTYGTASSPDPHPPRPHDQG